MVVPISQFISRHAQYDLHLVAYHTVQLEQPAEMHMVANSSIQILALYKVEHSGPTRKRFFGHLQGQWAGSCKSIPTISKTLLSVLFLQTVDCQKAPTHQVLFW